MRGGQIYPGERRRLLLCILVAAVLHGLALWLWMLWSNALEPSDAAPGVLKIGLVVAASTSTAPSSPPAPAPAPAPAPSSSPVASASAHQAAASVAEGEPAVAMSNAINADNRGSDGQAGVDEALSAQRSWRAQVTARIAQQWRYPTLARLRALEGEVQIAFVLDREGVLVDTRVLQSSGHSLLDAAAVALVERAAPYPKPPITIEAQALSLNVPIHYRLPK